MLPILTIPDEDAPQAMYKSDGEMSWRKSRLLFQLMWPFAAKSAYSVSEKEIMALRHESIPCSSKTFFGQEDVKKLAERKRDAGVIKPGDLLDQVSVPFRQDMRLFKKVDNNNRSRRKNFEAQFYGYVDPSMYRRR